jgi:hypothetical protein
LLDSIGPRPVAGVRSTAFPGSRAEYSNRPIESPFMLRFSDAGQPHAGSQSQAQPAGVRKPAEKETAGDDARSSSNGLWGFEGVGWRDGGATRCELRSLRGR